MDALNEKGWVIIPSVVNNDLLERLRQDLEKAYVVCRQIQVKNGVDNNTDGTVHHLICFEGSFYDLLDTFPLYDVMKTYFNGSFILNSYGGVKNLSNKLSYVGNIHRDIRTYSGDLPLMLNVLVMLDDFTLENGATYLLSGSHKNPERPSDEYFFKNAERAVGQQGDVLLFNSNLWHAAGVNTTEHERRALTLTFTKPFFKQQLDYPRFFGESYGEKLPEHMKQVLGYHARIPENLDQWYQPREKRMYKAGQE
jgi:hypothetical protein